MKSCDLYLQLTTVKITAIDSLTNTITLNRVPAAWAANTQLNAISSIPNFNLTNELMTIVSVSSPTITVDSVVGLVVGDYVSEYGYTAIPQLPLEAHAFLAQLTAAKVLEGLGDRTGMETALQKADQLKAGLLTIASQRVDGSVKKIVNPSGGLRIGSGFTRNRR